MKRILVDDAKHSVTLTFNDNLYPKKLIEQALLDFQEVCDSNFENEKLVLKPRNNEIDINALGYEFYNYLLGLIKS